MVENTEEATVNVEQDSKRNNPKISKILGAVSFDMIAQARKAIKEGGDISIISPSFRKLNGLPDTEGIVRGKEIRDWGLDLDTLICPEPKKGTKAYQEKRIL